MAEAGRSGVGQHNPLPTMMVTAGGPAPVMQVVWDDDDEVREGGRGSLETEMTGQNVEGMAQAPWPCGTLPGVKCHTT
jgi:hypothetical protein